MTKQFIVCAAIKFTDGTVIAGARHWDSWMCNLADKLGGYDMSNQESDGFIDNLGNYLTRKEAEQVVRENKQVNVNFDELDRRGMLFSEELY